LKSAVLVQAPSYLDVNALTGQKVFNFTKCFLVFH